MLSNGSRRELRSLAGGQLDLARTAAAQRTGAQASPLAIPGLLVRPGKRGRLRSSQSPPALSELSRRQSPRYAARGLPALTMNKLKSIVGQLAATFALLVAFSFNATAQDQPLQIKYWLAMSQPNSHLFEVTIEVALPGDPNLRALDFQMPKWSPGRYAVFDFAKNVQQVKAREACPTGLDCTMPDSMVTRVDDQTWRIALQNRHPGMS